MAAKIGEKIGKLLVVGEAEPRLYGGRMQKFLLCQCECGREEELPSKFIEKRYQKGCKVCRRGRCVACGGEILRETKSGACCDECEKAKKRNNWNLAYTKKVSIDPEFNKNRHLRVLEKMTIDDDFAEKVRAVRRNAHRRYARKPESKQKSSIYQRNYYRENRLEILEKRRQRYLSLPNEVLTEIRERMRESWRKFAKKKRWEIRKNPAEYQKILQKNRDKYRIMRRQEEMASLRRAASDLIEKIGVKDE